MPTSNHLAAPLRSSTPALEVVPPDKAIFDVAPQKWSGFGKFGVRMEPWPEKRLPAIRLPTDQAASSPSEEVALSPVWPFVGTPLCSEGANAQVCAEPLLGNRPLLLHLFLVQRQATSRCTLPDSGETLHSSRSNPLPILHSTDSGFDFRRA